MPAIGEHRPVKAQIRTQGKPKTRLTPAKAKPVAVPPLRAAPAARLAAPARAPARPNVASKTGTVKPKTKTKTAAPKPKQASLAERVKHDPRLLARVLANPGQRSKLPSKYLTPEQRKQREMNTRLRAPITPGSTTTERDLAHESKAAMDVKYGPLEAEQARAQGAEQARARDVGGPGGFYDQYLKQLAYHHEQAKTIGAATNQQLQNTQAGITGLAGADLTQMNQAATKDAEARGATPGDLAQMASNAAAVRQGLMGSFVAQQANEAAAAQGFTSGLANIVGPGQRLSAQVAAQGRVRQAGEKIAETAREKGQSDTAYRSTARREEAKNVLAREIATGKAVDTKVAQTQRQQTINETKRSNKARETNAASKATADREAKAARDAANASKPNKYGIPADQFARWTTAHRQREIKKWEAKHGKGKPVAPAKKYEDDFFKKYGIKPANTNQVNTAKSQISEAKVWLGRIGGDQGAAGRLLTTGQEAGKVKDENGKEVQNPKIPKLPAVLVRAAMEMRKPGYISAGTADRLHRAGYSVPGLGLSTVQPTYNDRIRRGQAKGPVAPGRR